MKIFVDPEVLVAGHEIRVRGDEHRYMAYVRRARVGDPIDVLDGAGRRARAEVTAIAGHETVLRVLEAPVAEHATGPRVRVLLPLIKGDRMDAALEKLVEVGADEVVLWPAARCVVQLADDRRDARLAKYEAQLRAAARQSGRSQVPTVRYSDNLRSAIDGLEGARIALDPEAPQRLAVAASATEVTIASGPEGGLDPDELAQLTSAGFTRAGLGPRVLRAETAPAIAVALVRASTAS